MANIGMSHAPHVVLAITKPLTRSKHRTELKPGDYVTISASRFPFPGVLPLNKRSEDWIESISRSFDWNSRTKQKPYTEEKKKDGVDSKEDGDKLENGDAKA